MVERHFCQNIKRPADLWRTWLDLFPRLGNTGWNDDFPASECARIDRQGTGPDADDNNEHR
jgi:hypothetical protein